MHVWSLCLCSFYFNGILLTGCSDYKHIAKEYNIQNTFHMWEKKTLHMWSMGPIYGLESFSSGVKSGLWTSRVRAAQNNGNLGGGGLTHNKDRQLLQIHTPLAFCRGCSPTWANVLLDAGFVLLEMRENSREVLNVPGILRLAERRDCNRVVNCITFSLLTVRTLNGLCMLVEEYITCLDSGGFIHL